MSIKDKLDIFLITYNRKPYLQRTLDKILADDSPIKDFDITILDNHSTDGTTELIAQYTKRFHNLKHIVHPYTIDGSANFVKAVELVSKEYFWVLCDDDYFYFDNWNEVEEAIFNKYDIICAANYAFDNISQYVNPAYQLFQLAFIPAGIYKKYLVEKTIMAMTRSIYTLFPQCYLTIYAINNKRKIKVLNHPCVRIGLEPKDCSYNRANKGILYPKASLNSSWLWGYSIICSELDNNHLKYQSYLIPLSSYYICPNIDVFKLHLANLLKISYSKFYDIVNVLNGDLRQYALDLAGVMESSYYNIFIHHINKILLKKAKDLTVLQTFIIFLEKLLQIPFKLFYKIKRKFNNTK